MKTDQEELIRKRAYELWEKAGRPEGDDLKYWLQAAEEIQSSVMNGAEVLRDASVLGGPDNPPSVEAKRTPKTAAKKQPSGAAAQKKSAVSKTAGPKPTKRKGKRGSES